MRLNVVFDVWIKVGGDKGVGYIDNLQKTRSPARRWRTRLSSSTTCTLQCIPAAQKVGSGRPNRWQLLSAISRRAWKQILSSSLMSCLGISYIAHGRALCIRKWKWKSQQFPNFGIPFSTSSEQLLHSALHKNISSGKTLKTNVEVHSCIEQNSEVSVFRLLLALWYMRRSKTITTWSEESAIGGGGKVHALKQHKNGICSANFAHPGHLGALLRHFCTYLQRVFQLWLGFLEGSIFLSRQQWQEPVWGRELASSFLNRSTPTQPKPSLISEKAAWPWPARDNPVYLLETCCIERTFRYSSHARWRLWMKHLQACAHLRTAGWRMT